MARKSYAGPSTYFGTGHFAVDDLFDDDAEMAQVVDPGNSSVLKISRNEFLTAVNPHGSDPTPKSWTFFRSLAYGILWAYDPDNGVYHFYA